MYNVLFWRIFYFKFFRIFSCPEQVIIIEGGAEIWQMILQTTILTN